MAAFKGLVLTEQGFQKGRVVIDDAVSIEIGGSGKADAQGLILPCFRNCHTHLGDAFIELEGRHTVEELVAPPNGLKHRMLEQASDEVIVKGMKTALEEMLHTGTSVFCDFREGGVKGLDLLDRALEGLPLDAHVLGRPPGMVVDQTELADILERCEGLGISSVADWDEEALEIMYGLAKRSGKQLAFHCSEVVREELETVVSYEPDFLIHMTMGTKEDFMVLADNDMPVVVCPGSNLYFGTKPPVRKMLDAGVKVAVGSDNAMLRKPDMIEELGLLRRTCGLDLGGMLHMCYDTPRKLLNEKDNIALKEGHSSDFLVLEWKEDKGPEELFASDVPPRVMAVVLGTRIWRNENAGI